jgi:hypothetical protein
MPNNLLPLWQAVNCPPEIGAQLICFRPVRSEDHSSVSAVLAEIVVGETALST